MHIFPREFIKLSLNRFFTRYHYPITFLCILSLLIYRSYDRFSFKGLWAEDAQIFLTEIFSLGLSSIVEPYAGYFHTIPRLIAFFTALFPISLFPSTIYISCVIITAFIFSTFIQKEYSYIIPSLNFRFIVTILFAFVSGLYEILGNTANLHWLCFFYVGLVSIKPLRYKFSILELIFLFLSAGSAGETIVLIPVFLLRVVILFKEKNVRIKSNLIVLAILIFWFLLNANQQKPNSPSASLSIGTIFFSILSLIFNYYAFSPIIGDSEIYNFLSTHQILFLFASSSILYLAGKSLKKIYSNKYLIFLFANLNFLLLPILIFTVRPGSINYFMNPPGLLLGRYGITVGAWPLILWSFILINTIQRKYKTFAFLIFISMNIIYIVPRIQIPFYGKEHNYDNYAKNLEYAIQNKCIGKYTIPAYPEGWLFYFEVKDSPEDGQEELKNLTLSSNRCSNFSSPSNTQDRLE